MPSKICLPGIPNFFPDAFVYKSVPILDIPECRIKSHFQACFDFIKEALGTQSGRVLVHCNAGISRSGTVVIAYIMKTRYLSLQEASGLVQTKRPKVRPNDGFSAQLKEFEKDLEEESGGDVT